MIWQFGQSGAQALHQRHSHRSCGTDITARKCRIGRAVEHLKKNDKVADREKLIQQYSETAIVDLKKSIELGLQDIAWMKKDPDLISLHGLPEFQKLAAPAEPGEEKAETEKDEEPDEEA